MKMGGGAKAFGVDADCGALAGHADIIAAGAEWQRLPYFCRVSGT